MSIQLPADVESFTVQSPHFIFSVPDAASLFRRIPEFLPSAVGFYTGNRIAGSNEINFLFRISYHQLKIKKKNASAAFVAVMSEISGEPDIP
jgi:hypothetical protein